MTVFILCRDVVPNNGPKSVRFIYRYKAYNSYLRNKDVVMFAGQVIVYFVHSANNNTSPAKFTYVRIAQKATFEY